MKFAYRNREFWCKGYYVNTVGKNTKAIKTYIADQLKAADTDGNGKADATDALNILKKVVGKIDKFPVEE